MRILFVLAIVFLSHQVKAQEPEIGGGSLGFSFERGGSLDYSKDVLTFNSQVAIKSSWNYGVTFFYNHRFFKERKNGLNLGIGVHSSLFNFQLGYTNPKIYFYTGGVIDSLPVGEQEFDLYKVTGAYFSLDIPISYTREFKLKNNHILSPTVGVNIRSIVATSHDSRNTSVNYGTGVISDNDTTFYMVNSYKFGTRNTQIIPQLSLGLTYSIKSKKGGLINFHANYRQDIGINNFEIYAKGFDNVENNIQVNWANDYSLFLFLKTSNISFATSYTFPLIKSH